MNYDEEARAQLRMHGNTITNATGAAINSLMDFNKALGLSQSRMKDLAEALQFRASSGTASEFELARPGSLQAIPTDVSMRPNRLAVAIASICRSHRSTYEGRMRQQAKWAIRNSSYGKLAPRLHDYQLKEFSHLLGNQEKKIDKSKLRLPSSFKNRTW